jgi:crotonobetainyl-CoA:carnitine CoA-transferase CaiB-like acyl-CoA transferase
LDPGYGIAGTAASGRRPNALRRGRPEARHQYPILPCEDGFVRLCILSSRQWQGMFDWMGRPAEFADPSFNDVGNRFASPTLLPHIGDFILPKTRAQALEEGKRYRVPVAALLDLDEVLGSELVRMRRSLADTKLAEGVVARLPDGVIEIDGQRAGVKGAPPLLIDAPAGCGSVWSDPRTPDHPAVSFGSAGRPLCGLRVLDLGVIVVGAEQGRLLADFGADVIKVETAAFPDGSRAILPGQMPMNFACGHRNKRGLGLNLREEEGRQLFLRLVQEADVVVSNFKPGTLDSLNLSPRTLLAQNPRLIVADSSAYGASGSLADRMGYGPLVRASGGLTMLWRYPDGSDSFSDASTVYPDHVAARIGIVGVLALLIRRLRTGRGGTVSVSQSEVMLSHMAVEVAARSLTQRGHVLQDVGERDAPWGVFPCAGDDEWCVVSIRSDTEWRTLCHVMRRPDLGADPDLAHGAGRSSQRARIDHAVGSWLHELSPSDAMMQLQSAGVPAAAMLRVSELPDFKYFKERQFFHELHQAHVSQPIIVDNVPVRSERLAPPPLNSAPLLGEHTTEIARTLLRLSDSDIERLIGLGVLEVPPPKRPSERKTSEEAV